MSAELQSFLVANDLETLAPVVADIGAERVADLVGLDASDWAAMGVPDEQIHRLLASLGHGVAMSAVHASAATLDAVAEDDDEPQRGGRPRFGVSVLPTGPAPSLPPTKQAAAPSLAPITSGELYLRDSRASAASAASPASSPKPRNSAAIVVDGGHVRAMFDAYEAEARAEADRQATIAAAARGTGRRWRPPGSAAEGAGAAAAPPAHYEGELVVHGDHGEVGCVIKARASPEP